MNWAVLLCAGVFVAGVSAAPGDSRAVRFSRAGLEDRALAIWTSQIIAVTMGLPFEHKPASVKFVDRIPGKYDVAPVDDDWYYEIVILRALEKYGPGLTLEDLARQWHENSTGAFASAEQARLNIAKGIKPPESGHPRFNRLWLTVNHCRADLFSTLAPGMPQVAAKLARHYSHLTSYAEGADGTALLAAMISLGYVETDPKQIVRKAARVLHPSAPHRVMLEEALEMAGCGKTFREVVTRIEDRWRMEYPASNNAVANLGMAAMAVYYGDGDYLKTLNLAFSAADFTDAQGLIRDPWLTSTAPRFTKPPTPFPRDANEFIRGYTFPSPTNPIAGFDPQMRTPYVHQFNAGGELEVLKGVLVSAGYVGSRGRDLIQMIPINYARYKSTPTGAPPSADINNIISRTPYPTLSRFTVRAETSARSWYDSFQTGASVRKAGLATRVAYAYGNSFGDGGGVPANGGGDEDPTGFTSGTNNPANPRAEKGRSSRIHTFRVYYAYDLPFLRTGNSLAARVAGG